MEILTHGIFGLVGIAFIFMGGFILGAVFEFRVLTGKTDARCLSPLRKFYE